MAYIGFKGLKAKLAKKGIENPAGLAAVIGKKKYGTKKFNKFAAKGKKMMTLKMPTKLGIRRANLERWGVKDIKK